MNGQISMVSGAGGWTGWAARAVLLLICLALPLAGGAATRKSADKEEANPLDMPMIFSIVRSNAGYCEPNCPEWIYGEGQIDATTPAAFRAILGRAGLRKLPLLILSPGGNVAAALEIGRMVRKRGMNVEVAATRFSTCSPRLPNCEPDGRIEGEYSGMAFSTGAFCWSACPLILAAGERRLSSAASHTGVHQITTIYTREKVMFRERYKMVKGKKKVVSRKILSRKKDGIQKSTKLPKSTRKLLVAYFKDMGVEKRLLDAMLSTKPDKIRRLEPDEMLRMRLITETTSSGVLASPSICSQVPLPDNCIMRPIDATGMSAQGAPGQN